MVQICRSRPPPGRTGRAPYSSNIFAGHSHARPTTPELRTFDAVPRTVRERDAPVARRSERVRSRPYCEVLLDFKKQPTRPDPAVPKRPWYDRGARATVRMATHVDSSVWTD